MTFKEQIEYLFPATKEEVSKTNLRSMSSMSREEKLQHQIKELQYVVKLLIFAIEINMRDDIKEIVDKRLELENLQNEFCQLISLPPICLDEERLKRYEEKRKKFNES